ncbi:MAG: prepilin-type N-terminal cleavage/methylation domain-containing protein [Gemmatimonadales bacterium]
MKGFTLVEVVVVLLILGLVAATAMPALPSVRALTPAEEARLQVVALVAHARKSALDRAATATLRINAASLAWRLTIASADSAQTEEGKLHLPEGATLADPDGSILARFYPDGTADAEPIVAQGGGQTEVVRLNRWTGVPE